MSRFSEKKSKFRTPQSNVGWYKLAVVVLLFGLAGSILLRPSSAATLPADINQDGVVNITDLSLLLASWNKTSAGTTPPTPPVPPTPPTGTDGVTAATTFSWGAPDLTYNFDNLNGWTRYDNGSRIDFGYKDASNITTTGGILTIKGRSNGHTGGMSSSDSRKMGRWEVRSKTTSDDGSKCWRPVHLLWPTAENWPVGGEVDYAESGGDLDSVSFFLHYGSSNSQTSAEVTVNQQQWHNYAVEWNGSHIAGYVDGKLFFEDKNVSHLPPGPMHPTLQLDSQGQDELCNSNTTWQIDWMKIYKP